MTTTRRAFLTRLPAMAAVPLVASTTEPAAATPDAGTVPIVVAGGVQAITDREFTRWAEAELLPQIARAVERKGLTP